jgi:hypothetical protein
VPPTLYLPFLGGAAREGLDHSSINELFLRQKFNSDCWLSISLVTANVIQ